MILKQVVRRHTRKPSEQKPCWITKPKFQSYVAQESPFSQAYLLTLGHPELEEPLVAHCSHEEPDGVGRDFWNVPSNKCRIVGLTGKRLLSFPLPHSYSLGAQHLCYLLPPHEITKQVRDKKSTHRRNWPRWEKESGEGPHSEMSLFDILPRLGNTEPETWFE